MQILDGGREFMLKLLIKLDAQDTFSDNDSACDASEVNSKYVDFAETFDVCWNDDETEAADVAYDWDSEDDDDDEEVDTVDHSGGYNNIYNVWWNDGDETEENGRICLLNPCIIVEQPTVKGSTDSGGTQRGAVKAAGAPVAPTCEGENKVEDPAFSPRSVLGCPSSSVMLVGPDKACIISEDNMHSAITPCPPETDAVKWGDREMVVPVGKWASLKAVEWCKKLGPLP